MGGWWNFDNLLPEMKCVPPGPRSRVLADALRRVESPDVTYLAEDFPVFWSRALGANVWDEDGNRYLDLNAGFGVAAVGHSHPAVVKAVQEQSARMMHGMGDVHPHELKVRLGEKLAALAPGGGEWKAIFGLSGTDAVEAAIKTAMVATGRHGVIAFEDAYHGLGFGALGVTAWEKFHAGFEPWIPPQVHRFPYPDGRAARGDEVIARITEFLDSTAGSTARIGAVIIEPILGRGGIRAAEAGFMKSLRALCDDRKILLITDEIYTGCGRTGTWLAADKEGVIPDLIAMGKALGGGMPISVCLGRAEIMDRWGASRGEARHTSTFLGHPLACAAALASLELLGRREAWIGSSARGEEFRAILATQLEGCRVAREIRGYGMMICIELCDEPRGEKAGARAWRTVVDGLRNGLILLPCGRYGGTLSLTPPLGIGKAQMLFAAETLGRILKT